MERSRKLYILFVGWVIFLTIVSLIPIPSAGLDVSDRWDKVAHFIAYFFTALLFSVAFRTRFRPADIYAVLFSFGYGAIIELVQCVMPHRVGSFQDLVANFSGVLFFFILYRLLWGKIG
jgi:VanZ family protein